MARRAVPDGGGREGGAPLDRLSFSEEPVREREGGRAQARFEEALPASSERLEPCVFSNAVSFHRAGA
jgi:hypothetical protein